MIALTPGVYRHYKGNLYRVWGVVRHSETTEAMVLYQALYGEYGLWVRPLAMFLETVEQNGSSVPRFALEKPEPTQDASQLMDALSASQKGKE